MHGLMEIRKMNRNPRKYAQSQLSDGQALRQTGTGDQKPRGTGDEDGGIHDPLRGLEDLPHRPA